MLLIALALVPASVIHAQPELTVARPRLAGPAEPVFVAIFEDVCGGRWLDPEFPARVEELPGDQWFRSRQRVTVDYVPDPGRAGCYLDPPTGPNLAFELGRLPVGGHIIEVVFNRHDEATGAVDSATHTAGMLVLPHARFESGFLYDPERPGHGFSLIVRSGEVVEDHASGGHDRYSLPQELFLSWQTYDTDGHALWLTGAAPSGAADPLDIELHSHSGMRFGDFDPADATSRHWGTLRVRQVACNRLHVAWSPDDPALPLGGTGLVRLVGTSALSDCEPDPRWGIVPTRRVAPAGER